MSEARKEEKFSSVLRAILSSQSESKALQAVNEFAREEHFDFHYWRCINLSNSLPGDSEQKESIYKFEKKLGKFGRNFSIPEGSIISMRRGQWPVIDFGQEKFFTHFKHVIDSEVGNHIAGLFVLTGESGEESSLQIDLDRWSLVAHQLSQQISFLYNRRILNSLAKLNKSSPVPQEPDDLFILTAQTICEATNSDTVRILSNFHQGDYEEKAIWGERIPSSSTLVQQVSEGMHSLRISTNFLANESLGKQTTYTSDLEFCIIPLRHDGICLGVVEVSRKLGDRFYESFSRLEMERIHVLCAPIATLLLQDKLTNESIVSIAQISHSLHTPLQNIRSWNDLIAENLIQINKSHFSSEGHTLLKSIDDAQKELDKMVSISADSLNTIIQSLRSQYEGLEPEPASRFLVASIIKQICSNYEPYYRIYNKGINIHPAIYNLPPVEAQKQKIYLLFVNVIDNALKYSHSSQIIKIFPTKKSEIVIESIGMRAYRDKDELKRLLFPFQRMQTKDPRRFIFGSGLGLPLCQKIIEEHGGELRIETKKLEGLGNEDTGVNYLTRVFIRLFPE